MKIAKTVAYELFQNLSPEEFLNPKIVAEQIRTMADEDESFKNKVFEVGTAKVLKECKKNFFSFMDKHG